MSNPKADIQLSAAKIKDALCLRKPESHEITADIIFNCLRNTNIPDLRSAQDDSVNWTAATADCTEDHHALQHSLVFLPSSSILRSRSREDSLPPVCVERSLAASDSMCVLVTTSFSKRDSFFYIL